MEPTTTIFRYNSRNAHLTKFQTIQLTHEDKPVGVRKIIDDYYPAGSIALLKNLNEQKNEFYGQIKVIRKQLETFKDVEVDEEFLKKFENMTNMQKKLEMEVGLKNSEKSVIEITKEILDIQKSGFKKK